MASVKTQTLIGLALSVGIALTAAVAPPAGADEIGTLGNSALCGPTNPAPLQVCFAATTQIGPVQIQSLDPNVTQTTIGYVGLVRLIVFADVVEVPVASFATSDLCQPYAVLVFPCVVVLSLPVVQPTPNPQIVPGAILGSVSLGTLTVKLNGQVVAVVPGYLALEGTCGPSQPGGKLFDLDCDGYSNLDEILMKSNPLYSGSYPGHNGAGFPGDWDADHAGDVEELAAISNPLQACSSPANPNGWPADPDCEEPGGGVLPPL